MEIAERAPELVEDGDIDTVIVAGDIGATKSVLAVFEESAAGLRLARAREYASAEFGGLEDMLGDFLRGKSAGAIGAACFGVPGPVVDGRARLTNLPWTIDAGAVAAAIGTARVRLLNDLEATAYGMLFLKDEEFSEIQPAAEPARKGNVAVIAPGTGLGEGMLFWDGTRHHPIASEGGHRDFAPRCETEIDLLRYLRAACGGHVSYERVLSGPGLCNLYAFLRDSGLEPEPPWLRERLSAGDRSAAIAAAALAGEAGICVAALDMFCEILGAEAANLALTCMANGGVILGGGIPPKILPALQGGGFLRAFADKGRFADLLSGIAVRVALSTRAPLLGAAHFALRFRTP